jgi:hypothetical protein
LQEGFVRHKSDTLIDCNRPLVKGSHCELKTLRPLGLRGKPQTGLDEVFPEAAPR